MYVFRDINYDHRGFITLATGHRKTKINFCSFCYSLLFLLSAHFLLSVTKSMIILFSVYSLCLSLSLSFPSITVVHFCLPLGTLLCVAISLCSSSSSSRPHGLMNEGERSVARCLRNCSFLFYISLSLSFTDSIVH